MRLENVEIEKGVWGDKQRQIEIEDELKIVNQLLPWRGSRGRLAIEIEKGGR